LRLPGLAENVDHDFIRELDPTLLWEGDVDVELLAEGIGTLHGFDWLGVVGGESAEVFVVSAHYRGRPVLSVVAGKAASDIVQHDDGSLGICVLLIFDPLPLHDAARVAADLRELLYGRTVSRHRSSVERLEL